MRLLLDTHTLLWFALAQAMVEGIPIISNDLALDAYGITRLW